MMLPLSITFRVDLIESLDLMDRLSELFLTWLEDGRSSGDSVLLPGSGRSSFGMTSCERTYSLF